MWEDNIKMGNTYVVYKDVNWIRLVREGSIAVFCMQGFTQKTGNFLIN